MVRFILCLLAGIKFKQEGAMLSRGMPTEAACIGFGRIQVEDPIALLQAIRCTEETVQRKYSSLLGWETNPGLMSRCIGCFGLVIMNNKKRPIGGLPRRIQASPLRAVGF
jgi:hypothetical protein